LNNFKNTTHDENTDKNGPDIISLSAREFKSYNQNFTPDQFSSFLIEILID